MGFVIVTSLRIVTDGNKETTYLLTFLATARLSCGEIHMIDDDQYDFDIQVQSRIHSSCVSWTEVASTTSR